MNKRVYKLINDLYFDHDLREEDLVYLLDNMESEDRDYLLGLAYNTRNSHYGKTVYMRGLIEFTNYCKRECKYCGINIFNKDVKRYRITQRDI